MKFKAAAASVLVVLICAQLTAAPKFKKQMNKLKEMAQQKKEPKYDLELKEGTDLETAVTAMLPKNSTLVHQITEGVYGPAEGKAGANINVIYSTAGKTPEIMVLTQVKPGKYSKTKAEVLNFGAGNSVEVVSVFYNQIDKDAPRELLILCYVTGKKESGYQTAVFDWQKNAFKRVPALESKLAGQYPAINVRRTLHAVLAN
ncbi:MAG: hypothetical protein CVV49_18150 [Spirochaetae bacterium HGW-Spirochaetae-5]|nr:MAG: hypothetical protein CVV49_18150 [Spirochaetae bacterium HGW-Spirochaetae-5]